jgi:hypothetical protein
MPYYPSSATASAAWVERSVRSRTGATLERTVEKPFAAAHGATVDSEQRFRGESWLIRVATVVNPRNKPHEPTAKTQDREALKNGFG